MKKATFFPLLFGTLLAGAGGVLTRLYGPNLVFANSSPVALTAEFEVQSSSREGDQQHTAVEVFARRRDGSHVLFRKAVNGRPLGLRVINDAARGLAITVDPQTRSTVTYVLSGQERAALAGPPAKCEEGPEMKLAAGVEGPILTHPVLKFEGTTRGGQNAVKRWLAPTLNCLIVRTEMETEGFHNVRRATSIVVGDPDPELFSVPTGYVERSPSGVLGEARKLHDLPSRPHNQKALDALDSVYLRRKQ